VYIECGAKTFDKSGRYVGKVEKTILNLLTGEMAYFIIKDERAQRNIVCRPEDVKQLSQKKLELKFSTN
jgi:sporulation protein YlmC with PRC-barrel domain